MGLVLNQDGRNWQRGNAALCDVQGTCALDAENVVKLLTFNEVEADKAAGSALTQRTARLAELINVTRSLLPPLACRSLILSHAPRCITCLHHSLNGRRGSACHMARRMSSDNALASCLHSCCTESAACKPLSASSACRHTMLRQTPSVAACMDSHIMGLLSVR